MADPWFDAARYAWMPGTLLGVSAGLIGGAAGVLAPRGKAKQIVLPLLWTLIGISGILLVAGIVALVSGQPYGVWYGLLLPGIIGLLVLGINAPMLVHRYRQAEARKIQAHDLAAR